MKKIISLGAVLGTFPLAVFAEDAFGIVYTLSNLLNNWIIPLLITVAVVYFIWGVISYITAGDEEKKKTGKTKIINGLIGLFVIVAFWGIIRVFSSTFNVGPEQLNNNAIPCIPSPGSDNC